ncbi:hypothetical protein OSB04_008137 [Centaurea solstitialis]|uniref:Acid phosphatase/vanadium-dependent haloperoxidase-related protein n=1 Tax=Centaurea solstitialis TaxID=347529 RepID=A0AA38U4G9_9ASTR|nr:hypothetical protein OSB04_008137 [Centaurea solstitialis]
MPAGPPELRRRYRICRQRRRSYDGASESAAAVAGVTEARMMLQNWSFSSSSSSSSGILQLRNQIHRIDSDSNRFYSRRRSNNLKASLRVGTDVIVEIAHNKALIAAAACAAVGQLAKPFTASILYRRDFDPKAAIQAGGFPSTHSSAAVATAMSVGLERGFSDAIFGLAVVYAALTMYDAQGVRREVGVHAKTLNKVLNTYSCDSSSLIESETGKLEETSSSLRPELHQETLVMISDKKRAKVSIPISGSLKESIGHTEIEVAAGALLGLLGSLAIYSL